MVDSVDSTQGTFVVTAPNGSSSTYTLGSGTKYFLNGQPATSGDLQAGLDAFVVTRGSRSSACTTDTTVRLVYLVTPKVFGRVTAVNGLDVAIASPKGVALTVQIESSTTFYVGGALASTPPTLTVGEFLVARGMWDVTVPGQIDAAQIYVIEPSASFPRGHHKGRCRGHHDRGFPHGRDHDLSVGSFAKEW
jgi:hypothetical protein